MTDSYAGNGEPTSGTSPHNVASFQIAQMMNRMATMTLVRVEAVNGRRVDVLPLVAQLDGAGNATPHATIHNVPTWRYQAGGAAIDVRPLVGDVGMAVFAHSDISSVKANDGKPSNPGSRRKFDWADAVYLGGLFGPEPTTVIRLSAADGIEVLSDQPIRVTAPRLDMTGDLTVSGKVTAGAGSTFKGVAFDTHTHSGVTAGTAVSGPPIP